MRHEEKNKNKKKEEERKKDSKCENGEESQCDNEIVNWCFRLLTKTCDIRRGARLQEHTRAEHMLMHVNTASVTLMDRIIV